MKRQAPTAATDSHRRPRDGWLPAAAMLAITLVVVAALQNGIGTVGVMAPVGAAAGTMVRPPELPPAQRVPFDRVDRAIKGLRLEGSGRPEQFEAYERLLEALAHTLPAQPDAATLARTRKLLSASLPAPATNDIMGVLPDFLAYRRAEVSLLGLSPGAVGNAESAWLHLELQHALRQAILGAEITERLYGTTYRMTQMHLVHQLLMQRQDLPEDRKRRLLKEQMEALTARQATEANE